MKKCGRKEILKKMFIEASISSFHLYTFTHILVHLLLIQIFLDQWQFFYYTHQSSHNHLHHLTLKWEREWEWEWEKETRKTEKENQQEVKYLSLISASSYFFQVSILGKK
jgi:exopolyphosphatase/pppGpp-phosphohydrolase